KARTSYHLLSQSVQSSVGVYAKDLSARSGCSSPLQSDQMGHADLCEQIPQFRALFGVERADRQPIRATRPAAQVEGCFDHRTFGGGADKHSPAALARPPPAGA